MKYLVITAIVFSVIGFAIFSVTSGFGKYPRIAKDEALQEQTTQLTHVESVAEQLSIAALKNRQYTDTEIKIEEKLVNGSNYSRYRASYNSDGLKIYALLTIPNGEKPATGWPVVVFNHGYIPPTEYRTTEKYIAYTDAFSRNGYIVLRSDYRGHDKSEGIASGAYGSNDYTIDVLNALAAIKKYPDADANRIGMWGHSMGGFITLRSMVVNKDIKVGVIWAGVVASYPDLLLNWRHRSIPTPVASPSPSGRNWRQRFTEEYGTVEENPNFWNSISANSYLNEITAPIQLHHGTADSSVPVEFSQKLEKELLAANKKVELYTYTGDDHNISKNFSAAMSRSVAFFDTYLKNSD